MPSCNVQNHDFELVKRITDGITPVPFEGASLGGVASVSCDVTCLSCDSTHPPIVDATRDPMEDEGKKLIEILNSSQAFRTVYLVRTISWLCPQASTWCFIPIIMLGNGAWE